MMLARRFGGGLAAASFALLLLLGSAPAVAGNTLGSVPWWAAAPAPGIGFVPPARQAPVTPPVLADSRWAWRAEQGYRWRPMEAARLAAPPVRAAWGPRRAPPAFAMAAPVVANPWGRLPPPRTGAWRAPAPVIVTVDGTPYRFRPAAPSRGPMVAHFRRVPGPVGYPAFAPTPALPPMLAARWPAPVARVGLPPGQPWLQLPGRSSGDNWYGYRFRPDPRFASQALRLMAPEPGLGQQRHADSRAWPAGPDLRAMPAEPTAPWTLPGGTVAYLYD